MTIGEVGVDTLGVIHKKFNLIILLTNIITDSEVSRLYLNDEILALISQSKCNGPNNGSRIHI